MIHQTSANACIFKSNSSLKNISFNEILIKIHFIAHLFFFFITKQFGDIGLTSEMSISLIRLISV